MSQNTDKGPEDKPGVAVTPAIDAAEAARRASRRRRSIALGWALAAVVIIFYAITVVKMGPGIFNREL